MGWQAAAAAFVISAVPARQRGGHEGTRGTAGRGAGGAFGAQTTQTALFFFFFQRRALCMNGVVGCLKQAEKTLGSWGSLREDGPSAACGDLVNSATKSQSGAAHLPKSKPWLGFRTGVEAQVEHFSLPPLPALTLF